jgi:tetratricopeptide (TPR) repeat protein
MKKKDNDSDSDDGKGGNDAKDPNFMPR